MLPCVDDNDDDETCRGTRLACTRVTVHMPRDAQEDVAAIGAAVATSKRHWGVLTWANPYNVYRALLAVTVSKVHLFLW